MKISSETHLEVRADLVGQARLDNNQIPHLTEICIVNPRASSSIERSFGEYIDMPPRLLLTGRSRQPPLVCFHDTVLIKRN